MSLTEAPENSKETGFEALGLSPGSLAVLREIGFTRATPIQTESIPALLQGRDLIGQSKTGSGKTAAFALPILERLVQRNEGRVRTVQALVLCPTRELCTQVAREIRRLGRRIPGLQVLVLSGGVPLYPQLTALEKGVHVVVGTPGRVLDHLTRRKLDLSNLKTFVLDEADRMLDMGFEAEMESILRELPRTRQTVLFSATFPPSIEAISRRTQRMPVRVTIEDESAKPSIRQTYYEVEMADKPRALLASLAKLNPESAIVFCNLKATVAEVGRALRANGIDSAALHGDLEQSDRDRVLAKFRNRSLRVLIATDVAARGIDIADLDLVYNYDLPSTPEVYVHRIGRTGRAGKTGLAIAFVTSAQTNRLRNIEDHTGVSVERETIPAASAAGTGSAPTASRSIAPNTLSAKMETLYLSAGRKDKMRPGDILGALTGEAGGLNASDIGKIEIHDRFSYVAVSRTIAAKAMQSLLAGRVKGRRVRVEIVR
ncbi:MAG: ATP-dependent RNA helicase DbpA [Bdellovibrionales bacterium]|nr:ATP-dependent RNA helicase DbpA [Bdellovibrionales bacterium]